MRDVPVEEQLYLATHATVSTEMCGGVHSLRARRVFCPCCLTLVKNTFQLALLSGDILSPFFGPSEFFDRDCEDAVRVIDLLSWFESVI